MIHLILSIKLIFSCIIIRIFTIIYNNVITPFVPSTLILCPSFNILVALSIATTAGIPYSLATIAAWDVGLPISVTAAAATLKRGVQIGDVYGDTSIYHFFNFLNSEGFLTMHTEPSYTPRLAALPLIELQSSLLSCLIFSFDSNTGIDPVATNQCTPFSWAS